MLSELRQHHDSYHAGTAISPDFKDWPGSAFLQVAQHVMVLADHSCYCRPFSCCDRQACAPTSSSRSRYLMHKCLLIADGVHFSNCIVTPFLLNVSLSDLSASCEVDQHLTCESFASVHQQTCVKPLCSARLHLNASKGDLQLDAAGKRGLLHSGLINIRLQVA